MDFGYSQRSLTLQAELTEFMNDHVIPAEAVYDEHVRTAQNPHEQPPVMEELKKIARDRGLWNLFMTHGDWGAGLTNTEYAPLAEIVGRSIIGPETINCSAPDTGNMELLAIFGTPVQQQEYLRPLLAGTIRSCFAMTEPGVASSDARNISTSITRDGDSWVINGRKWFTSGVLDPNCRLVIVMGLSNPNADPYRRQSMILVPRDSPGLEVVRDLKVFGYSDRLGHGEVVFDNVRVPASAMLGAEGDGFALAQGRLGPGRMHYAMRMIGFAERGLDLMCDRALSRTAFGNPLSEQGVIQEWIARSRIEIEQARLLTLKASWLMDTAGNKAARVEVAAIKVAALAAAQNVLDRALQIHGAAGVSGDTPIARMYALARALRIADGPDEVHLRTIAKLELKSQAAQRGSRPGSTL
jgi:acyl-CoA dehydrogenase